MWQQKSSVKEQTDQMWAQGVAVAAAAWVMLWYGYLYVVVIYYWWYQWHCHCIMVVSLVKECRLMSADDWLIDHLIDGDRW